MNVLLESFKALNGWAPGYRAVLIGAQLILNGNNVLERLKSLYSGFVCICDIWQTLFSRATDILSHFLYSYAIESLGQLDVPGI